MKTTINGEEIIPAGDKFGETLYTADGGIYSIPSKERVIFLIRKSNEIGNHLKDENVSEDVMTKFRTELYMNLLELTGYVYYNEQQRTYIGNYEAFWELYERAISNTIKRFDPASEKKVCFYHVVLINMGYSGKELYKEKDKIYSTEIQSGLPEEVEKYAKSDVNVFGTPEDIYIEETDKKLMNDVINKTIVVVMTLFLRSSEKLSGGGKNDVKKSVYYRMFFTDRVMDSARNIVDSIAILARHENLIMETLDDGLMDFVYTIKPFTMQEIGENALKTNQEVWGSEKLNALEAIAVPMILEVYAAYLNARIKGQKKYENLTLTSNIQGVKKQKTGFFSLLDTWKDEIQNELPEGEKEFLYF